MFLFKIAAFVKSSGLLFSCLFFSFFSFLSLEHVPVPTRAYVSFHLPGWSTRESWPKWSTWTKRKDGISRTGRTSRPESSMCSLPPRPHGSAWPHGRERNPGQEGGTGSVSCGPSEELETVRLEETERWQGLRFDKGRSFYLY